MPSPIALSSRTSHVKLLLAGRALVAALVIGAIGVVGYDLWLWLFSDGALEHLTGLPLEARIEVSFRPAGLPHAAPTVPAAHGPTSSRH